MRIFDPTRSIGEDAGVPAVPGAVLVRPGALAAAVVLGVNDHLLKPAVPSWLTGKLSDFAYCYLVPLVLFATLEWAAFTLAAVHPKTRRPPGHAAAVGVCLLTALHFTVVQLSPALAEWHAAMLHSALPWLRFRIVADPTDLLALPMVALAYRALRRHGDGTPRPPLATAACPRPPSRQGATDGAPPARSGPA